MATQQEIDKIIEKMCEDIVEMYKDVEIDTINMHDFIIKLMECVEMIPKLVGADKKNVVKGVLLIIIEKIHIKQSEKDKIIYILTNNIIDIIIDLIVKMTKTSTTINHPVIEKIEQEIKSYCEIM